MKKLVSFLLMLSVFMTGCAEKREYNFMQPLENISKIEIVYFSPYDTYRTKEYLETEADKVIEQQDWESLISQIEQMQYKKEFMDPSGGISSFTLRITYLDGAVELVCARGSLYITEHDDKMRYIYFDKQTFYDVLHDYLSEPG